MKLSSLGITKMQSSRWQSIAALPKKDFEGYIREHKQGQKEITTAGALKLAKVRVARPASPRFGLSHPESDG